MPTPTASPATNTNKRQIVGHSLKLQNIFLTFRRCLFACARHACGRPPGSSQSGYLDRHLLARGSGTVPVIEPLPHPGRRTAANTRAQNACSARGGKKKRGGKVHRLLYLMRARGVLRLSGIPDPPRNVTDEFSAVLVEFELTAPLILTEGREGRRGEKLVWLHLARLAWTLNMSVRTWLLSGGCCCSPSGVIIGGGARNVECMRRRRKKGKKAH